MSYDANTARIQAAEAKAKADAIVLAEAQPLLDHIYAEIKAVASEGGDRYSSWFDSRAVSFKAFGVCGHRMEPGGSLMGHELLINPGDFAGPYLTRLGQALLDNLRSAGYKAAIGSYPGGKIVVSWEADNAQEQAR